MKFAVRFPALLSLLSLAGCASAAQERGKDQENTPTIKVEVALVNLTATVIDRAGRPVPGLRKEDFEIYEDGVPQQIAVFRDDEDVPVSVGILFDTSGSMADKIEYVEDAVIHFVNTVHPEDDIFVMQFSTRVFIVQDFTPNRQRLRQAVQRLRAQGSTSLYDAVVSGLKHVRKGHHRRKALLVLTDGNDTSSEIDLQSAVDFAIRSEVPVYCLGIGHGEHGSFGHPEGLFKDAVDVDTLRAFANLTGGRAFVLQGAHRRRGVDRIDQACQQVAAELRQQYTLGYYPRDTKDEKYKRIRVRVKRGDLKVRARDGYFASRAGASRTNQP